jgi:hypothetical protein
MMVVIEDIYRKMVVSRHRNIGAAIASRNRLVKEHGQGFEIKIEDDMDGVKALRSLTKDEESVFRMIFKDF